MLEIIRPGLLTTVQDLGRPGWRHLGVTEGGALDAPALRLANLLAGNPVDAAALEICGGPLEARLHGDGLLALTGAVFDATLDGAPLWPNWCTPYRDGQRLRLHGPRQGRVGYLALAGGLELAPALGSRATDLAAGIGGWQGRALAAGDALPLGRAATRQRRTGVRPLPWSPVLRALPGPEYPDFDAASRRALWAQPWTVGGRGNRMGCQLQGQPLRYGGGELLSHGVLPGVVQVPPSGEPIVLLADAQATGGYPRIACVIAADLWKLAQARPGCELHLVETDTAGARAALVEQQRWLQRVERSLNG